MVANERPVGEGTLRPFLLQLKYAKVKQFKDGVIVRESSTLRHFAETEVDRLNGVSRIHNFTNSRGVVEKLLNINKALFPDGKRAGIFIQKLAETLEFNACGFETRRTIDFFK